MRRIARKGRPGIRSACRHPAAAAAVAATCRRPLPCPPLTPWQHIRDITDPEHPYTLEQLSVVSEGQIAVDDGGGTVQASCAAAQ